MIHFLNPTHIYVITFHESHLRTETKIVCKMLMISNGCRCFPARLTDVLSVIGKLSELSVSACFYWVVCRMRMTLEQVWSQCVCCRFWACHHFQANVIITAQWHRVWAACVKMGNVNGSYAEHELVSHLLHDTRGHHQCDSVLRWWDVFSLTQVSVYTFFLKNTYPPLSFCLLKMTHTGWICIQSHHTYTHSLSI